MRRGPGPGLLRGREFVMKDSYSFDIDDAGLAAAYERHRQAYIRIFDRLGFEYVMVAAMSGAMGGSASEEFLAVSPHGEDTFVRSDSGSYAANVEAVEVPQSPAVDASSTGPAQVVDTPGTPTIETLVAMLNERFPRDDDRGWNAADTLKNVLVLLAHPDGTREPLAIGVPGDREIDLKRLEAQVAPAEVAAFDEAEFARHPELAKGYIGPGVLGTDKVSGIRYLLDPRIAEGSAWVTGADKSGFHVIDLVYGRDFTADGTIQAAEVRDGDPSPDGNGTLHTARGIEMGHIFQLGRKYADALGLQVLDANGKLVTVTMGSYGVGVSRAVAAVAENTSDDKGLVWPRELAPADVHLVIAGKGPEISAEAERIAAELDAAGVDVLLDDRPASPGVKFADAELLGVPTICVVGRGVADGVVEIRDRASGSKRDVPVADAVAELVDEIRG